MRELARATVSTQANTERFLSGELGFLTAGKAKKIEQLLSERGRQWVRESPRWEIPAGHVPVELVVPLIEEAFNRYGVYATADQTGLLQRQLFGTRVERQACRFNVADQIVVRLASPGWWYETPERKRWLWNCDRVFGAASEKTKTLRARRRERELVAA